MDLLQSVVIESMGHYLPPNVVTNEDLSKRVDTSDEWIRTRTGIRERRIADASESPSNIAVRACLAALEKAKIDKSDVDLLIVATMTSDFRVPSIAAILQAKLGLKNIMAFDVLAACAGFVYALEVGRQMMLSGHYNRALIVGTDKMSDIINWEDRSTCVLFGDGAGAAVLKRINAPNYGLLGSVVGTDGQHAELLYMLHTPRKPSDAHHPCFLEMNGREIFKYAVRWMEKSILDLLEQHSLKISDISLFVPHQANMRILEALADRLHLPIEKFYINIDRVANTSAASIPIALSEALDDGRVLPGQYVVLVAFGAGFAWGASLIKTQPKNI